MYCLRWDVKYKFFTSIVLLFFVFGKFTEASRHEYTVHNLKGVSEIQTDIIPLERQRRDAPTPPAPSVTTVAPPAPTARPATTDAPTNDTKPTKPAAVDDANRTTKLTEKTVEPPATVSVTQIPLLGVNGSGILKINLTENTPKVSDPITPTDDIPDVFSETLERISAEHNVTNKVDHHLFYNSTFIGNETYFNAYWANISSKDAAENIILSNSYRRATTIQLRFDFPFYGYYIRNITVATGGFIFVGEVAHSWLAATQYIAPLMANFDTSATNNSLVKLYEDNERFTAFWENVTLQENKTESFTFAVTLYKNGEIIFAYKNVPIDIQNIADANHPVKIGISDAYSKDNFSFMSRRKTIYEYHRVSFKNYVIANKTVLRLIPLPTCLQYTTCESCVNHETGFNCTWCPQTQSCSSGMDRNRQDWVFRHCNKTAINMTSACPAASPRGTVYSVDEGQQNATVVVNSSEPSKVAVQGAVSAPPEARSAVGGAVTAFLAVAAVCCLGGWVLYAFRNPHTRSGQLIIKYRPSQWSWRRGEARYTAATIHM